MKYTFKYNIDKLLPNISDEEIQQAIDEEGLSGLVTPRQVKDYVYDKLVEMFTQAAETYSAEDINEFNTTTLAANNYTTG